YFSLDSRHISFGQGTGPSNLRYGSTLEERPEAFRARDELCMAGSDMASASDLPSEASGAPRPAAVIRCHGEEGHVSGEILPGDNERRALVTVEWHERQERRG